MMYNCCLVLLFELDVVIKLLSSLYFDFFYKVDEKYLRVVVYKG